jgi:hypothetical protein
MTVTALALSDQNTTSLIIDIDICFLVEVDAAKARKAVSDLTGVAESNIRLSYTHTHSDTIRTLVDTWFSTGTEMLEAYIGNLQRNIAGTAWAAMRNQVPARVAGAKGNAAISVNRRFRRPGDGVVVVGRNWDGPVDPEVQVLRFDTMAGEPLAAIVNFACHPITVGPDNDLLTPDYPGVVKRTVAETTGATTLFLQGAAGDSARCSGTKPASCGGQRNQSRPTSIMSARWNPARRSPYTRTVRAHRPIRQCVSRFGRLTCR